MPQTDQAIRLRFDARLETPAGTIRNHWPLWVFPAVTQWPAGLALLDPTGSLIGLDDLWQSAQRVSGPTPETRLLLTSVFDDKVINFVRQGGAALLLQQGDGPLPAVMRSFWPSAIKILYDHPAINALAHEGFVDMQFYGLGTDWAFDPAALATALPADGSFRSLMRRLDPAQFTEADYIIEAQIGAGRLIASTLRFQGGLGDQPNGLRGQVAGRWLLYQLLVSLEEGLI
jgi:hypothetical protein